MNYILDTNIFIRFFTADHAIYTKKAGIIISKLSTGEIQAFIPESVFVEIFYVLEKVYKRKREEIIEIATYILSFQGIRVADMKLYKNAIKVFAESKDLDIEDCFVIEYAKRQNSVILSFDKDIDQIQNINRIESPS